MHRPPVSQILASSFALCALTLGPSGCEAPPVELEPTPTPAASSTGDYRLTELSLEPAGTGLDLTGDAAADNNFPYLLDSLYVDMEAAVLSVLAPQVGATQAAQLWTLMSVAMTEAGLPISSGAYNATESNAVRTTQINYLPNISSSGDAVSVVFYSGVATPIGYQHNSGVIGNMDGNGTPDVMVYNGDLILLYPQSWFNLPLEQIHAAFSWTGSTVSHGQLGGAISIQALVDAVLSEVPDVVVINGQPVQIPKDAIAKELTLVLEASTTPTGAPLFDLTSTNGKSAISACYTFSGGTVQIAPN